MPSAPLYTPPFTIIHEYFTMPKFNPNRSDAEKMRSAQSAMRRAQMRESRCKTQMKE